MDRWNPAADRGKRALSYLRNGRMCSWLTRVASFPTSFSQSSLAFLPPACPLAPYSLHAFDGGGVHPHRRACPEGGQDRPLCRRGALAQRLGLHGRLHGPDRSLRWRVRSESNCSSESCFGSQGPKDAPPFRSIRSIRRSASRTLVQACPSMRSTASSPPTTSPCRM